MIHLNNLRKQFGDTIACDIPSFTINEGDVLGLVGNNGAGKTTLFRLMLDLLQPDEGCVTLNDIDPAKSEEWKAFTGAYLDEGFLIDYLTPEEYYDFIAKISGISQDELHTTLTSFEHFASGEVFGQGKLIRNLSAGNRQKVGIMSAFVRHPKVVILDEPFNYLDPSSQSILKRTLTAYSQQTGATILISSHNLQHTIDISTRIALLEKGRIIKDLPNIEKSAKNELIDYFGGD